MTREQAAKLAAEILATWPANREDLTTAIYLRELLPLDHHAAVRAVAELRRSCDRLPSIAAILDQYQSVQRRIQESIPRLPALPMSEEERQANLERAYELLHRIGRPITSA